MADATGTGCPVAEVATVPVDGALAQPHLGTNLVELGLDPRRQRLHGGADRLPLDQVLRAATVEVAVGAANGIAVASIRLVHVEVAVVGPHDRRVVDVGQVPAGTTAPACTGDVVVDVLVAGGCLVAAQALFHGSDADGLDLRQLGIRVVGGGLRDAPVVAPLLDVQVSPLVDVAVFHLNDILCRGLAGQGQQEGRHEGGLRKEVCGLSHRFRNLRVTLPTFSR